ncbi:uncharacterized protein LOC119965087 isoform X2 [Scyliorhinus canicula]|uniref:uncharacterized protein LOC119965087 isoform X2 n=1 Tax=Scyliorhinus canicula TaxID=7830 RepID=UPI0018F59BCF|nr:uncharacterized protein LOC119965087 isoform X2 [Scyliorhinus canicula]
MEKNKSINSNQRSGKVNLPAVSQILSASIPEGQNILNDNSNRAELQYSVGNTQSSGGLASPVSNTVITIDSPNQDITSPISTSPASNIDSETGLFVNVSDSDVLTDGQMSPVDSPSNREIKLMSSCAISRYLQQSFTSLSPEDRHSPTVNRKTSHTTKVTPVKPHIFVNDTPTIGQQSTRSSSAFHPMSEEGFLTESAMWITDNLPSENSSTRDVYSAQNEDPSIASVNYPAIRTRHQTQPNDSEAATNDNLHLITNPSNMDYTRFVVIPHGTEKLELLKGARPLGRYVQTKVGATQGEGQGSRHVGVSLGKSNPSSSIRRSPANVTAEVETQIRSSPNAIGSQALDSNQQKLLDHDTLFMSHRTRRVEQSLTSSNSSTADQNAVSGNMSDSTTHDSATSSNPSTTGFNTLDKAHRSRRGIHPLSVSKSKLVKIETQSRTNLHPVVKAAGNKPGETEHWVLHKGGRITKRLPVSNDARSTEQETTVRRSSYTAESQLSVTGIVNAAKNRDVR